MDITLLLLMQTLPNFEIVSTPLSIFGNTDVSLSIPEGAIGTTHRPHYSNAQLRDESSAVWFLNQLEENRSKTISDRAKWEEILQSHISRAEWRQGYALANVMHRETTWRGPETYAPLLGALTLYLLNSRGLQYVAAQTPEDGLSFNFKHLGEAFWLGEDIAENYPQIKEEVQNQRALTTELLLESAIQNPLAALQVIERMAPHHRHTGEMLQARRELRGMLSVRQISEEARQKLVNIIPERLRAYAEAEDPVGASEFIQLMVLADALTREEAGECLLEAAKHINSQRYAKSLTHTLNQYGDPVLNDDFHYASRVESLADDPFKVLGRIPSQVSAIIDARLLETLNADIQLLDHSGNNDPAHLYRIYFETIERTGHEPSSEVIDKYLEWLRSNNRLGLYARIDRILVLCKKGYIDEERRFMELSMMVDNLNPVWRGKLIDIPLPEFGETRHGQLYLIFEDPLNSTVVRPGGLITVVKSLTNYAQNNKLDIGNLVNIPSIIEKLQAMIACLPRQREPSELYSTVNDYITSGGPGLKVREVAIGRLQAAGKKRLPKWHIYAVEHEIKENALHITLSTLWNAITTEAETRHQAIANWCKMINDACDRTDKLADTLHYNPYGEVYV